MKIYEEGLIEKRGLEEDEGFDEFWDNIRSSNALIHHIENMKIAPPEKQFTERYRLVPQVVDIAKQLLSPGDRLLIEYTRYATKIMIYKYTLSDIYAGESLQKFQEAVSLCDTLIFDPCCDFDVNEEDGLVITFLINNVFS